MSKAQSPVSTDDTKNVTDVATRENEDALLAALDTDTLANIQTLDDVEALLTSYGIEAVSASDVLGDGFALVDDKESFIGKGFVVLKWDTYPGDYGTFSAMHVVTRDPVNGVNKFVIIDGGTGIHEQLNYFYQKTGRSTGLVCRHGLRASEYMRCETHGTIHKGDDGRDDTCKETPGKTYYLDTSA